VIKATTSLSCSKGDYSRRIYLIDLSLPNALRGLKTLDKPNC